MKTKKESKVISLNNELLKFDKPQPRLNLNWEFILVWLIIVSIVFGIVYLITQLF